MTVSSKELGIPLGEPIELVALAVKELAIRCRILDSHIPITFRKVRGEVEGEIITVRPEKLWQFKNTNYMSGKVESVRIDIPALNLEPLSLKDPWPWKPKEEYWGEPDDMTLKYFKGIKKFGQRISYEMEQILPFDDPEEPFDDPITVANDLFQGGQFDEAYRMMEKLLVEDLRCLDAHAHLGNWLFNRAKGPQSFSLEKSRKHYEVGVRIGELSFPGDENIVLPWGRIDNRPYLRCLHGYGLALWRMGEAEEAHRQFERMLWFNPSDNQGARFLLMDMDEGKTWDEVEW
ncbi:MAG: hypothetical protein KKD56_10575 [Acidobacteria bacterium]|nr:hypothetical protein [Acidobacteriota bacterium]